MRSRGPGRRRIACWLGVLMAATAGHQVVGGGIRDASGAPTPRTRAAEAAAKRSPRLSRALARKAHAVQAGEIDSEQMVDVIITHRRREEAEDEGLAARVGAVRRRRFMRLPFQAVRVPARELQTLADDPDVEFVSPDSQVFASSLASRQTARVPGSTSWLNTSNTNYRGQGVTVAVLDTGVWPHDDFYRTLVAQFDFVNGAGGVRTSLGDPYGHGTHVAGMLGSDGYNSSSYQYQGVATRANVVALRVLDSNGAGRVSDVLAALDWILYPGKAQYDIRVANLSFGKGVEEPQADDPLVQAVNAVWDAGVVVVVSAGNFGESGHYTVSSPANSRKVITVGSLTDSRTGTSYGDDYVSTYSSRGPTLYDHVLKPDLVAPGNKVIGPFAQNSRLGSVLPWGRIGCGDGTIGTHCSWRYMRLSGTSMAAAMVSGAVARMIGKDPSLSPSTVKARLMKSARKVAGDPTRVGAGVLDVEDAMNATGVMSTSALSPLMELTSDGTRVVHVQDTARLWESSQWSAGYIWRDGYLWSNAAPLAVSGYLWSNALLWPDNLLWADGYLWSNGFVWSQVVRPTSVDIEDP